MNRVKSIEQHYSIEEVAGLLSVHKNTVRNWIREGSLSPVRRVGQNIVRVPASAIQRMMNAETSEAERELKSRYRDGSDTSLLKAA